MLIQPHIYQSYGILLVSSSWKVNIDIWSHMVQYVAYVNKWNNISDDMEPYVHKEKRVVKYGAYVDIWKYYIHCKFIWRLMDSYCPTTFHISTYHMCNVALYINIWLHNASLGFICRHMNLKRCWFKHIKW